MASIMDLWVKKTVLEEEKMPIICQERCINAKQSKISCDACIQMCPAQAIVKPGSGEVQEERCKRCGICTAVCPAGAWGFLKSDLRRMFKSERTGSKRHVLACRCAETEADSRVWCLSALTWEQVSILALNGCVEIVKGACETCERKNTMTAFERTTERVRLFLGDERYEQSIRIETSAEKASRKLSRRDIFSAVLPGKEKNCAEKKAESYKEDGRAMRMLLIEELEKRKESEDVYGWRIPVFSEACSGCGICARVCPNEAISMRRKEEKHQLLMKPTLCTTCGVCMQVCAVNAIKMNDVYLKSRHTCIVYDLETDSCSECGAPMPKGAADRVCLRCRAIQKQRKKREAYNRI